LTPVILTIPYLNLKFIMFIMLVGKIKEWFFRTVSKGEFYSILDWQTRYTGVKVNPRELVGTKVNIHIDKPKEFHKLDVFYLYELAREFAAHEAGEFIYLHARKSLNYGPPSRIIGETVGEFFRRFLLPLKDKPFAKIEYKYDGLPLQYVFAKEICDGIEELPLEKRIRALHILLFGSNLELEKEGVETEELLERLSLGSPYKFE
jgi:hypothetical protein